MLGLKLESDVRLKKTVLLPLILLSLGLTPIITRAETFSVPQLQRVTRNVGLGTGDKVSGSVTVVGGSRNDINFYVTDPNGYIILSFDRVTDTDFSFSASMTGTYLMHFDNTFSFFSSKSVTLDYTVTKSILGIPQETFLVVLAAVLIVIAVIIVVVLARRKR